MSRHWQAAPSMALALLLMVPAVGPAQPPPLVAAASDLSVALTEIADQFGRETGQRVTLVFGSSGTITRQVLDGAPFELFLSADEGYVTELVTAGLARDNGVLYAVGRLALFAPHGSPLVPSQGLGQIRQLVGADSAARFAIANPAHAPYGRAAEAALRKAGLWDAIRPRLVLGENVSQAAQFASSGNAVGGLVAYSLVLAPALRGRGTFALIPASEHAPLRQRMVLTRRAGAVAERFYAYLQERTARIVLERYGFTLPR